jgi:hypothetical protein
VAIIDVLDDGRGDSKAEGDTGLLRLYLFVSREKCKFTIANIKFQCNTHQQLSSLSPKYTVISNIYQTIEVPKSVDSINI